MRFTRTSNDLDAELGGRFLGLQEHVLHELGALRRHDFLERSAADRRPGCLP